MIQFKLRRAEKRDLAACGQMANGSTIEQYYFSQPGAFQRAVDKAFAAEQIDALAMAIENISDKSGMILGDQTGVGKGRVVAGIIRWANQKGLTPVFVTEKPNLFT